MAAAAKKAASRDMLKDFRSLRSQNRLAAIKVPNEYDDAQQSPFTNKDMSPTVNEYV